MSVFLYLTLSKSQNNINLGANIELKRRQKDQENFWAVWFLPFSHLIPQFSYGKN